MRYFIAYLIVSLVISIAFVLRRLWITRDMAAELCTTYEDLQ